MNAYQEMVGAWYRDQDHAMVKSLSNLILLLLVIPLALHLLIKAGSLSIAVAHYCKFCRDHTEFYRNAFKLKHRTLLMRLPVPWPSTKTYYLLDQAPMRKLFGSSAALDAFALARRLHHAIWGVPPLIYKETFREGAKQIHKELSSRNLGPVKETFEKVISARIVQIKAALGVDGVVVPLHQTWYRLAYEGNMRAIFGPDLPVEETRVAVQEFASGILSLSVSASLPILPNSWWNRIIPSARRGVEARQKLYNSLLEWQKAGGLETASDSWKNIMKVIMDKNVPLDDRTLWINMVMFGFQGNTPEQPGWIFTYLLQSPKLWAAIKEEVAALPSGSLIDVNFKAATPLMHSAVHETLRLCTATFAGRQTTRETKIAGCEETFPKGVLIRTMTRATAFDPAVWGHDPECFKGDRFSLDDSLFRQELMFGGGVSACPGRFFAQAELELLTAHLIREFDFDTSTVAMHQRLTPAAKDLLVGSQIDAPDTCEIIDLDGSRLKGLYPGIIASQNRMENISGSLFPLYETTCHVTPC